MIQGEGYRMDSAGHEGLLRAGDVQWMFAGKGLLHSEGPSKAMLQSGGIHEFVQLWVNVPAKYKWHVPSYQSVTADTMPLVLEQEGVFLQLASGEMDGKNRAYPNIYAHYQFFWNGEKRYPYSDNSKRRLLDVVVSG